MQEYIEQRVLEVSRYIIESGATVRQTAGVFGVSKSTVHMEVTIWNAGYGWQGDSYRRKKAELYLILLYQTQLRAVIDDWWC